MEEEDTFNTLTTSTIDRVDITSTTSHHPHQQLQFQIQFNFSYKSLISYWIPNPNHHHDPQLVDSDDSQPPEVCSTALGPRELLNRNKARRLLNRLLRGWFPFRPIWRRLWIDQVLERARDDVGSMPRGHNTVVVDFRVVMHHAMVYYEDVGSMFGDVEGANNNYMVPSKESWIESVVEKNKIVLRDSSETCTVCLEDFSDDGSGGVLMPCAHVFHRDCIGKWLRTSHYCPVCRFEFPTAD